LLWLGIPGLCWIGVVGTLPTSIQHSPGMVNDFSDMLLDPVYHCFIEDFCIDIH
jgi:hypothetical protein